MRETGICGVKKRGTEEMGGRKGWDMYSGTFFSEKFSLHMVRSVFASHLRVVKSVVVNR